MILLASTDEGRRLVERHETQQRTLRSATLADLIRLWRSVDPTNLAGTIGPFTEAAALLIRSRFGDSAGLAAGFYQALRRAEGVSGTATVVRPDPPEREEVAASVRGAGLSGIINARRAGRSVEAATDNGLVKVAGSAATLVLAGGRRLLTEASVSDPRSRGWRWNTTGENCPFCSDRSGTVFSAESRFRTHDHCDCRPEPVFS